MKNFYPKKKLWLLLFIISVSSLSAQTIINGFFPKQNEFTFASSYSYKSFDKFYRGNTLSESNPINMGKISSSIINVYGEYGLSNWLSSIVTVPYVSVRNENEILDPIQGVSTVEGIQDINLVLKAKIADKKFSNSYRVSLGSAIGISLPVGGYEEAGILSLGNGATAYDGCGFVQFKTPSNIFIELQAAYSLRTNSDFEVPNAMLYSAKLGYYNKWFYAHAKVGAQNSLSGFDIGSQEFMDAGGAAALPETRVNYTNLFLDLYIPVYKNNFGISSGYAVNMDGRNYDKASSISLGLVYKTN